MYSLRSSLRALLLVQGTKVGYWTMYFGRYDYSIFTHVPGMTLNIATSTVPGKIGMYKRSFLYLVRYGTVKLTALTVLHLTVTCDSEVRIAWENKFEVWRRFERGCWAIGVFFASSWCPQALFLRNSEASLTWIPCIILCTIWGSN